MDASEGVDLFEVVANPTRAGILRTLAESHGERPGDPALTFSELRERVGTRDSGNFNYHLDKLLDRFVQQTDDGYVLRDAGLRLVGAILSAEGIAGGHDREPEPLGEECPICEVELVATYESGFFRVACTEGHFFPVTSLPASAVEGRSTQSLIELSTVAAGNDVELLRRGACPRCYADVDGRVLRQDVEASPVDYRFVAACGRCGMAYGGPVGMCVLREPRVVGHFAENGVDVSSEPLWRFGVWTADDVTVESEDPLRLTVAVTHDAGAVDVTVDGSGSVTAVSRR